MRTLLIGLLMCLFLNQGFSEVKLRFGLTVSPMLSWLRSEAGDVDKGKIRAGVDVGVLIDINFPQTFTFGTGAMFSVIGGNLVYKDSLLFNSIQDTTLAKKVEGDIVKARFKLQYLNFPILLKLKTKEIGRIVYYGGFGLIFGFRTRARVDATLHDGTTTKSIFNNANIVKKKDQTGIFKSRIINISLHVEGGIEYNINSKTAILAGLFFDYGFIDLIEDSDNDKMILMNIGLRAGVLF